MTNIYHITVIGFLWNPSSWTESVTGMLASICELWNFGKALPTCGMHRDVAIVNCSWDSAASLATLSAGIGSLPWIILASITVLVSVIVVMTMKAARTIRQARRYRSRQGM